MIEAGTSGFVQIVITGALLLHAIAHAIAVLALISLAMRGNQAQRIPVSSWLFSKPSAGVTALLLALWTSATLAFAGSAAASWGILIQPDLWGLLAMLGAGASTLGILLTGGFWPGSPSKRRAYLNSAVAMAMNIAVLSARVWLQWLPSAWIIG